MSTRNPFDYLINGVSLLTSVRIQLPLIVRTIANPPDSDLQIVNPFREVSVKIPSQSNSENWHVKTTLPTMCDPF